MNRMLSYYLPRVARNGSSRERWKFFALGLATIYEGMVIVLSLGYLNVEARAYELFGRDE